MYTWQFYHRLLKNHLSKSKDVHQYMYKSVENGLLIFFRTPFQLPLINISQRRKSWKIHKVIEIMLWNTKWKSEQEFELNISVSYLWHYSIKQVKWFLLNLSLVFFFTLMWSFNYFSNINWSILQPLYFILLSKIWNLFSR